MPNTNDKSKPIKLAVELYEAYAEMFDKAKDWSDLSADEQVAWINVANKAKSLLSLKLD